VILRLLADADLKSAIVTGVVRRNPSIDSSAPRRFPSKVWKIPKSWLWRRRNVESWLATM
jgi:hypothetical protein